MITQRTLSLSEHYDIVRIGYFVFINTIFSPHLNLIGLKKMDLNSFLVSMGFCLQNESR